STPIDCTERSNSDQPPALVQALRTPVVVSSKSRPLPVSRAIDPMLEVGSSGQRPPVNVPLLSVLAVVSSKSRPVPRSTAIARSLCRNGTRPPAPVQVLTSPLPVRSNSQPPGSTAID